MSKGVSEKRVGEERRKTLDSSGCSGFTAQAECVGSPQKTASPPELLCDWLPLFDSIFCRTVAFRLLSVIRTSVILKVTTYSHNENGQSHVLYPLQLYSPSSVLACSLGTE